MSFILPPKRLLSQSRPAADAWLLRFQQAEKFAIIKHIPANKKYMSKPHQEFRYNYFYSGASRNQITPPKPSRKRKRGLALTAFFVTAVLVIVAAKTLLPALQSKAHDASLSALALVRRPPINETPIGLADKPNYHRLRPGNRRFDYRHNQRYPVPIRIKFDGLRGRQHY